MASKPLIVCENDDIESKMVNSFVDLVTVERLESMTLENGYSVETDFASAATLITALTNALVSSQNLRFSANSVVVLMVDNLPFRRRLTSPAFTEFAARSRSLMLTVVDTAPGVVGP